MQDWQIPSRSLLSLSMLCEVPINCLYGYPVTDNVRSATKHLTPHLGYKVVSGLRAVYTIITMRVTYDTLHNFACSTLITGQSGITITLNLLYLCQDLITPYPMIHEIRSSVYLHNSLYALRLSLFTLKLDYGYFKNSVLMFNLIS
ncbi:hypothetical protein QL285_032911 [Trifolium repens]|nr:hypothetical protein QL285_032911 [Trifolium repens]